MRKMYGVTAGILMGMMIASTVFAGEWKRNETGYWWQNDDGSWPASTWTWCDGNHDGVAECYYFDQNGYMVANTAVQGYYVNNDGQWVENDSVVTKNVNETAAVSQTPLSSLVGKTFVLDSNISDFGRTRASGNESKAITAANENAVTIDGDTYTFQRKEKKTLYKTNIVAEEYVFGKTTNSIYGGYMQMVSVYPEYDLIIFHGEEDGSSYYAASSKAETVIAADERDIIDWQNQFQY